jgi:hypothetical protein
MVRHYGLYANAHRGNAKKASLVPVALRMAEEEPESVFSKDWAEMVRTVYEVAPLICPRCGGRMKVVAFLADRSSRRKALFRLFCGFYSP